SEKAPTARNVPKHVRGARAHDPERRTVLLCAHMAGDTLFGGERSFIDVARGCADLGFNIHVTLPRYAPAYIAALSEHVTAIHVFPYPMWNKGVGIDDSAVESFRILLRSLRVDVVHVNTIVIREP